MTHPRPATAPLRSCANSAQPRGDNGAARDDGAVPSFLGRSDRRLEHVMRAQPDARAVDCAEREVEPVDRSIAALATAQGGVVGHAQLLTFGLTRRAIGHRLGQGRLIVLHRGVDAVGHQALTDRGRGVAALLAAGPGAVLSHRAAAAFLFIVPALPAPLEVTRRPAPLPSRPGRAQVLARLRA